METLEQKYKVRSGTVDFGKEYEYKMAALLSLRCVLQKADDFWIASNADGVGAFDDIILQVKMEGTRCATFMMQLKHKEKPKNITEQEFLSPRGDFSLAKYFADILKLKEAMDQSKKVAIIKRLGSFEDIHFVLYTNRGSNRYEFFEKHPGGMSILNTSIEDEGAFKLNGLNLPDSGKSSFSNCLGNVSLCSNQISAKDIDSRISEDIERLLLATMKLKLINVKNIAKEFTLFVIEWAKGNLGGNYFLTKQDVMWKLSELVLSQHQVNLAQEMLAPLESNQHQIWSKIISKKSVTVIENHELVLTFLNVYLSIEVHRLKCFATEDKLDEEQLLFWAENLTDQHKTIFFKEHDDLKSAMLKTVGNQGSVTPMDIYKCLWMHGQLPLLLEITEMQDYKNIIRVLKMTGCRYKVIILNKTCLTLPRTDIANCFYTMQDLNQEHVNDVLDQPVKLQHRSSNTLKNLIDESMYEYVKSSDIVNILCNNFNIGNKPNELPEYFIERTISKFCIRLEALEEVENDIFLLENVQPTYINELEVYQLKEVNFNSRKKYRLIASDEHYTDIVNKLKSFKVPVHCLHFLDAQLLEWKWTFGSTKRIKPYSFNHSISESDLISICTNTVSIISATPGMGKSTLMDSISYRVPSSKWVLRIDLLEHNDHFKFNNSDYSKSSKHLQYFNSRLNKNDKLAVKVFKKLMVANNVVVLLDGFDEVSLFCKEQVTSMAKCFQRDRFTVWITTRPVMQSHLENEFLTFASALNSFTTRDQQLFLINYFTGANKDLGSPCKSTLLGFVKKLLHAAKENLHDRDAEFTGVPLLSKLLADAFNDKYRSCLMIGTTQIFDTTFDLLYLYQNFINKKMKIFTTKYGAAEEYTFEEHQSLFSLMLLFQLNDPIKRDGIIMVDEKLNISCIHRTFAEYLAAKWLAQNLTNPAARDLIEERFSQNYHKFLFNIFDRFVAVNCPLHLAIVNNRLYWTEEVMNSDWIRNQIDNAGRSLLHMAALYGTQQSTSYYGIAEFRESDKENRLLNIVRSVSTSELVTAVDILGYTPLECALKNRCLGVANQLCQQFSNMKIRVNIPLEYKRAYFRFCYEPKHKPLLKTLAPYFVARELLLCYTKRTECMESYFDLYDIFANMDNIKGMNMLQYLQSEAGNIYSGYDNNSYSDLRFAVLYGDKSNVKTLLQKNVNINEQDADGNTVLHYAVIHKNLKAVKFLISKGADINIQNSDKNAALHLAILQRLKSIAKFLLSKGARINLRNKDGSTVLHLIADNMFIYSTETPCFPKLAIQNEVTQLLISNVSDVNVQDNKGNTALHYAAEHNRYSFAKDLVAKGSNVNIQNDDGDTPLHIAVKNDDFKTAELLLLKGASVNLS